MLKTCHPEDDAAAILELYELLHDTQQQAQQAAFPALMPLVSPDPWRVVFPDGIEHLLRDLLAIADGSMPRALRHSELAGPDQPHGLQAHIRFLLEINTSLLASLFAVDPESATEQAHRWRRHKYPAMRDVADAILHQQPGLMDDDIHGNSIEHSQSELFLLRRAARAVRRLLGII